MYDNASRNSTLGSRAQLSSASLLVLDDTYFLVSQTRRAGEREKIYHDEKSLSRLNEKTCQKPGDVAPYLFTHVPLPINQIESPSFNGERALARKWLIDYEKIMAVNTYSDEQKLTRIIAYVSGEASDWLTATMHLMQVISFACLVSNAS